MVGWLVTLGVILLLIGILLIPAVLQFVYDDLRERSFLRLSWLGIPLWRSDKPQKQKKHRKKHQEKSSHKPEPDENDSGKMKRYWHILQDTLAVLPRPLRLFWKGLSVHQLSVIVRVGRFDAKDCAVAYGMTNAVLYYALGLLQSSMRVSVRQIQVQCGFGEEDTVWCVHGRVHVCLFSGLAALFSFVIAIVLRRMRHDEVTEK